MNVILSTIFFIISIITTGPVFSAEEYNVNKVLSLEINSSINPATFNYLSSGFQKAKKDNFDLVLIKINTPGGLISTTKQILTLFGSSDIPTAVWVTPEGASATSAGAIIASGAHILAMSDGTNIGAATPVGLGKDIPDENLKAKAINDLVALVQSLCETRGRNGILFGEMIKKASSFKAREALKKNLINGIANQEAEIFKIIDGKTVAIKGKPVTFKTGEIIVTHYKMDFGQRLLDMLANPNMAYILFILGAALLYLELQAPGGFIAGSIGVVSLLFAGIGFQILSVNFGALALISVSFVLFILEAYVTSYGLISLAGVAALTTGSFFLMRTDQAYIELSSSLIISTVLGIVLFLVLIGYFLVKDVMKQKKRQFFSLVGKTGIISEVLPPIGDLNYYQVKISGERWKAASPNKFEIGNECEILEQNSEKIILKI